MQKLAPILKWFSSQIPPLNTLALVIKDHFQIQSNPIVYNQVLHLSLSNILFHYGSKMDWDQGFMTTLSLNSYTFSLLLYIFLLPDNLAKIYNTFYVWSPDMSERVFKASIVSIVSSWFLWLVFPLLLQVFKSSFYCIQLPFGLNYLLRGNVTKENGNEMDFKRERERASSVKMP